MTVNVSFDQGEMRQVARGTTLEQLLVTLPPRERMPLAALVNGTLQELDYPLYSESRIEWLDYNCSVGWRVYRRSLVFLLQLAVNELFPERRLWVSHSLSEGLFCWLDGPQGQQVSAAEVEKIEAQMRRYVAQKLPITRSSIARDDAAAMFRAEGKTEKALLLERRREEYISIYTANGLTDFFFGKMAVNASYLPYFHLLPYEDGFVMHLPAREYLGCVDRSEFLSRQLQTTLAEYHEWSELMGVKTVSDLNAVVERGPRDFLELVLVAETLHERNLHRVSDAIYAEFPTVRLVLIAGPSSSGKTTTTRRLGIQFRTLGIKPVMISLDDYFVDREKTPRNASGKPDFEGLAALDLQLFEQNMQALLAGEEAALPHYDFVSGKSIKDYRRLRLADDEILLVEGIHALNEALTVHIPHKHKRKIFISALTQLNLDSCNPVSASDNRLIRRIVRDMQFRNSPAAQTLDQWEDVRRGEHHNIFPWQDDADHFINSVLIYELPVLRPAVEAALMEIDDSQPSYLEAQRLLRLIRYFSPAPADVVPRDSILQEFLGNSIFEPPRRE